MDKAKVLGRKLISFVDEHGRKVEGLQLWLTLRNNDAAYLDNTEIGKFWISEASSVYPLASAKFGSNVPSKGSTVAVEFNRYGKIVDLQVVADEDDNDV